MSDSGNTTRGNNTPGSSTGAGNDTNSGNGTNSGGSTNTGGTNTSPQYFWICSKLTPVNAAAALVLDVDVSSPAPNKSVVLNPRSSTPQDSQLWSFDSGGYIVSKVNDYVLDVSQALPPGVNTILSAFQKKGTTTQNQQWTWKNGYIVSQEASSSVGVVDVKLASPTAGTPIILFSENNPQAPTQNQQWYIESFNPTP